MARIVPSFGSYVQAAFLNHWNLLAFLGTAALGFLSGQPDVIVPLAVAGELAYLGLLASHPKFQKYVDAQRAKARREESSSAQQRTLDRILDNLPRESYNRYRALRSQCRELQQIAQELKRPGLESPVLSLEEHQRAGLDRLLWIYLRLLYTQYALSRFLEKTDAKQLQAQMADLEARLAKLPPDAADERTERVRRALADNLATSRDRLANLMKARDNYQLVVLEIDRLENKIRSLSEMAVNRQEPEFISSQVDQVAESMIDTERTMNDLQFATGLDSAEVVPPQLLREKEEA